MTVKDKAIECIDTSILAVEKMLCEIDLAGSLTADKKVEMRDILKGVALSAFEDARQSLNNNEGDHYFINPLAVALVTSGAIWGELRGARNVSKMMSDYAKIRLENDPKQLALKEIEANYKANKHKFKRRGYSAQFTREMHDKYPEIKAIKTIENLVTELNKDNELIPR